LLRFVDGELDAGDDAPIVAHIEDCLTCQERLEQLTARPPGPAQGLPIKTVRTDHDPTVDLPATEFCTGDDDDPDVRVAPPRAETAQSGQTITGSSVHRDLAPDVIGGFSRNGAADQSENTEELPRDAEPGSSELDRTASHVAAGNELRRPARRQPPESWPVIDGYDILERLGEGGMGVVYKARQCELNRLVALKTIREGSQARADLLTRFRIEAEAIARLRHPNILQIYDIGTSAGVPFVVLELLDGGSLGERLAGNPQPARAAAELLAILARAVHVAHQAGVIHRDLKPSNVLYTTDGVPKITDFGLAKRLDSDTEHTESGQIMGSPSYMAPEQARGDSRNVGPAADVHALGAILYEMVTGRPPFKGETPIETVRQVIDDDPVTPSRLVPRLPRDVETICLKCLAKEPRKRFASAQALADDLDRFRRGETVLARRTPSWERAAKWARRRPVAATVLALITTAAFALLVAGVAYDRYARAHERLLDQRLAADRTRYAQTIFQAQETQARGDLAGARAMLRELRPLIESEPKLGDLHMLINGQLTRIEEGLAEQSSRAADRARYDQFLRLRNEAFFRDTQFTGLDLPGSQQATCQAVEAALAVFAAPASPGAWRLAALPASLAARERTEIAQGCYELLLVLAQAEPTPKAGLRRLDQAARLRPPTRAHHLRRAACLTRAGDSAGAERELRLADRLPASTAFDHFLIGQESYKRGDPIAAIRHFEAAVQLQPDHFWAQCLSAICWLRLNRPTEARATLNACLKVEPEFAWLPILRGYASTLLASSARGPEAELYLEAAAADYRRAMELLDQKPNGELRYALLVNRGLLWLQRRDFDQAVGDMQAAIQLNPRHYEVYALLAQVYQKQDRPDDAVERLSRAIERRPELPSLYRSRADVQVHRRQPTAEQRAAALRDLEQAIRLEKPGNPALAHDHTQRAQLLALDQRDLDALAACDAAIDVLPGHDDAHQLRIRLLLNLKRYQDAARSCEALLARGKSSSELYELRALARTELMDYARAIEDYTQALALRPESAPLLRKRGWLYLLADAPRMALGDFDQAVGLEPSASDAYSGRGAARVPLGQHHEAVADAERALSLGEPTHRLFYTTARIYAQAAIVAATEVREQGQDVALRVARYQDRAASLLNQAMRRIPAEKRASFWRDSVQADPALRVLRRRLQSWELAAAASATADSPPDLGAESARPSARGAHTLMRKHP